jgi:LysM repeat protein
MKKQTDKSTIGLVIGSSVIGLAGVLCVGMLTLNALGTAVTAHADAIYNQQTELAQKYKTSIDDYNNRVSKASTERIAREKTDSNAGIVLPKDKRTESLDSLEVAGVDTSHIVEKADGTMVYMIQPGDTLTSISATLGYSVDELANFNQIRNVNLIYANSALRVPKGK